QRLARAHDPAARPRDPRGAARGAGTDRPARARSGGKGVDAVCRGARSHQHAYHPHGALLRGDDAHRPGAPLAVGPARPPDARRALERLGDTRARSGRPGALPPAVLMATTLGISAYYHDSAACLVRDGEIVAAAQEERFTRKRHDSDFPARAVAYCLAEGRLSLAELDYVAFYDKPLLKFERLLEQYLGVAPRGLQQFVAAMPVWLREKLFTRRMILKQLDGFDGETLFAEHHESHAASAFYPSPFAEAAVLTMDGVGEWATSSWGVGRGNELELLAELHYPHSLGMLYSAFTYYTGFKVNSGEYKVMGLAPYGQPRYADVILDRLVELREDGSFKLDMRYFNFLHGFTMTNGAFDELFGGPPRKPESPLTQREMDLAASVQQVTEEIVLRMARHVHRETGLPNLCLAGGVALNCVANGRLLREGPFERLWVRPAAGR